MAEPFRASAQRGTVAPSGRKQFPSVLLRGGQAHGTTFPCMTLDVRRERARPRSMSSAPYPRNQSGFPRADDRIPVV